MYLFTGVLLAISSVTKYTMVLGIWWQIIDVWPYYPAIWWMTLKTNRAHLLCYVKLCASFQSHWCCSLETLDQSAYFVQCNIDISWWPKKIIGHLFYAISSIVHHFLAIGELQFGNAQFGSKLAIFFLCDLEIRRMTLKIMGVPILCYF